MGNSGRPARILHITFNMGIGGTEQVIRQIVLGLPRKDFSSQVLCIDGFVGDIGKQLSDENITVTALKRSPGFDWKLVCSIRKILRQSNVDVVHCHQYTPWVYGWLAAIGSGTKVVFTEHGRFHPDRYRYKAVLVNPLIAFTTDAVIAISNATKKAMQKYEFIPASRIKVIYNGIEPLERDESVSKTVRAELGIPADVTVLGTMARLDPVKIR
ncbi:glycosyltransferase [Marinobacter sp. AN1]|uniref:glycosyltransferase n=1 Tax=Marinobacter sp. AN1 TaxID=2886046 RepID=UPI00222EA7A1|nr:glycosyltransferase [Marinobacter sp. AN1]UZD66506.1 glycosyltransferase [Marinobacter sp. AN1]